MRGLIVFHDRVRRCASSRFRTALELSRSCDLTLLGAVGAQLISSKQLGAVRPERSAAAGCGGGAVLGCTQLLLITTSVCLLIQLYAFSDYM